MDVLDWLQSVIGECAVLSRVEDALALIPDIGADAPTMIPVQTEGSPAPWLGVPVAFSQELRPHVAALLGRRLKRWTPDAGREELSALRPDALKGDPLVRLLTELLVESGPFGARASSVVVLELARQCATCLGGDLNEMARLPGTAELAAGRQKLGDLDSFSRGKALGELVWSAAGRLGAAWNLAQGIDPHLRPTRLYQAFSANRLAMALPAGALRPTEDLNLIAGALDLRFELGLLESVQRALILVIRMSLEGAEGPVAAGIRDLADGREDLVELSLDPALASLAAFGMSSMVKQKDLLQEGLEKQNSKSFLTGGGLSATLASYLRVARAVRRWDVLSTLAARALPIRQRGSRVESRLGMLEASVAWRFLVPRGQGGVAHASVVAIDFSALYRHLAGLAGRDEWIVGLNRGLYADLEGQALSLGGVGGPWGSALLFAFGNAGSAQTFSRLAQAFCQRATSLDRGAISEPLQIPEEAQPTISVASGDMFGGWDGRRLSLWGPAIDELRGTRRTASPEPSAPGASEVGGRAAPRPTSGDPFGADEWGASEKPEATSEWGATSEWEDSQPTSPGVREVEDLAWSAKPSAAEPDPFAADPFAGGDDAIPEIEPESIEEVYDLEVEEDDLEIEVEDESYEDYAGGGEFSAPFASRRRAAPPKEPTAAPEPAPPPRTPPPPAPEPAPDLFAASEPAPDPFAGAASAFDAFEDEATQEEPKEIAPEDEITAYLPPPTLRPGSADEIPTAYLPPPPDAAPAPDPFAASRDALAEPAPDPFAASAPEARAEPAVEPEPTSRSGRRRRRSSKKRPRGSRTSSSSGRRVSDLSLDNLFRPGEAAPEPAAPAPAPPAPTPSAPEPAAPRAAAPRPTTSPDPFAGDDPFGSEDLFSSDPAPSPAPDPFAANDPFAAGLSIPDDEFSLDDFPDSAPGDDLFSPPAESGGGEELELFEPDEARFEPGGDPFSSDDGPFSTDSGEFDISGLDVPDAPNISEDLFAPPSSSSRAQETRAEPEPEPEPSDRGVASTVMSSLPDLEYLFQGYVYFLEGSGVVFGRRYGKQLLDVHTYACDGDLSEAYRAFLQDKISEGFVPRPDLTRRLPGGADLEQLDLNQIGKVLRTLA